MALGAGVGMCGGGRQSGLLECVVWFWFGFYGGWVGVSRRLLFFCVLCFAFVLCFLPAIMSRFMSFPVCPIFGCLCFCFPPLFDLSLSTLFFGPLHVPCTFDAFSVARA